MSAADHDPTRGEGARFGGMSPEEEAAERARDFRSYAWGIGLALALTLVPFALVALSGLGRWPLLWAIGALGLVQVAVHFRFFLHLGWHHRREDLQLILFTVLILILMIGGTIWIMFNLYMRMMPGI